MIHIARATYERMSIFLFVTQKSDSDFPLVSEKFTKGGVRSGSLHSFDVDYIPRDSSDVVLSLQAVSSRFTRYRLTVAATHVTVTIETWITILHPFSSSCIGGKICDWSHRRDPRLDPREKKKRMTHSDPRLKE